MKTNKIKRRNFMKFMGLGMAAVGLAPSMLAAQDEGKKKNVLFIVSDDMNTRLGCYGDPVIQTPNIDALAKRGVRFDRAYCQYPVCNPSRASFMTGLYVDQVDVYDLHTDFRKAVPDVVTLPQHFKNNGYFTARSGKIYHQGVPRDVGRSGLDDPQSWDEVRNPKGRDKTEENKIFSFTPGKFGGTPSWRCIECEDDELTDGMVADDIIEMMEAHKDEPFFLAAGFYRPHTPYVAPKKYFDMHPLDKIEVAETPPEGSPGNLAGKIDWKNQDYIKRKSYERDFSDEDRKHIIQAYFASASHMDAQVGRLLDALKRLGLEDDTVVIFIGDHGYSLGEHNHWMKSTIYETDARAPMIMGGPGIERGGVCPAPVEFVDIYPTLAAACGLPVFDWLPGMDLAEQLVKPQTPTNQTALTQARREYSYAIRDERYCLAAHWAPEGKWQWPDQPQYQMFDHKTDPKEWYNVIDDPEYAEVAERLKKQLENHPGYKAEAPKTLAADTSGSEKR
ncbi:MAG: sulfatase [Candidatus Sumerlaeota bacterium]